MSLIAQLIIQIHLFAVMLCFKIVRQGRPVPKVILKNDLNASRYLIAAESESFFFVDKVVKERMNYDFLMSSEVILSAL